MSVISFAPSNHQLTEFLFKGKTIIFRAQKDLSQDLLIENGIDNILIFLDARKRKGEV